MKRITRHIAIMLAILMLLQCAAVTAAPDTEGSPVSVVLPASDAENKNEIIIPEGWAHDALAFCVAHGILNGDQNGDLRPAESATRAQLAAMVVRMFDAKPEAELSAYIDVDTNAWYYSEMARAVAMGIFEGSGGKLEPQKPITREQAFTVLARAFGVGAQSLDALNTFPDGSLVSTWARATVAAMLEADYVHGNTDGTLNPKGYITRQELAQVLCNALDVITADPDALTGSRNLYTGAIGDLEGKTIDGDLILSCSSEETVALSGFCVTGRLVLQLHDAKKVCADSLCDTLSVCCPVDITLASPVEQLICLRDDAFLRGEAKQVLVLADAILGGSYDSVICLSGNPSIGANATVKELTALERGSSIALYGDVGTFYAQARYLSVTENGHIGTLYQYNTSFSALCTVDTVVDRVDAGLDGIRITPTAVPKAYYDQLTVTVAGRITGINTTQAYGVPDGIRTCTVVYSYNGTVLKTEDNFKLIEGAELSCTLTAALIYQVEAEQNVAVTIHYGDESITGYLTFIGTGRFSDYHLAQNVLTIYVMASVTYTTSMYSGSTLSGYMCTLTAGTYLHFLKYTENGKIALVETLSGTRGWVSSSAIHVSWQNYHSDTVEYTAGVKEAFVNQVHSYSSPTKYLIWCNLYTTTVNVFEGGQGNWKLIKSSECTIGAPNSPTRPGVYSIYAHAYYWSFDDGEKLDVSRCYYASLFDGGIAFHTRLYYTGTNTMVNPTLGGELSHGCVRCPDDMAIFIYNKCPTGTTVVVY